MRINKFVATATGMSRRAADDVIRDGRVSINNQKAELSMQATEHDSVRLDDTLLALPTQLSSIMLNKPVGFVCSRDGQGSKTIYDLLPAEFMPLKPVGRLDKDSSGLLLLTNDGELAQRLTHPSFEKIKQYEITLGSPLRDKDTQSLTAGIQLSDGPSKLDLTLLDENHRQWLVRLHEGRNRQIRRSFESLGYKVTRLHRTSFGSYQLGSLKLGAWQSL